MASDAAVIAQDGGDALTKLGNDYAVALGQRKLLLDVLKIIRAETTDVEIASLASMAIGKVEPNGEVE